MYAFITKVTITDTLPTRDYNQRVICYDTFAIYSMVVYRRYIYTELDVYVLQL